MRGQRRQARAALAWCCGWGLLIAIGFTIWADWAHPRLHDPFYAHRLGVLRERLTEYPGDPLLLVIGSSRIAMAFDPAQLPAMSDPGARELRCFNFASNGAGPLLNLIVLERLLADGVRPDYLIVELMPPYLKFDGGRFLMDRAGSRDLGTLFQHLEPTGVVLRFARRRVQLRQAIARSVLGITEADKPAEYINPYGATAPLEEAVSDVERQRRVQWAYQFAGQYMRDFDITPTARGATERLLALCEHHGIAVQFLLTPEGPMFRSWYGPGAEERLLAWVNELRSRGYTVHDGRDWLSEAEMYDSHHVLRRGSTTFTQRFGRDIVEPMVRQSFTRPSAAR